MKIREIFGLIPTIGEVGIEIEAESKGTTPFPMVDGWIAERDGSLRGNSIEYILPKPCMIKEVDNKLGLLQKALSKHKVKIDYSFRAGVHIHLNMQEETIDTVKKLAAIYYALENLLVNFCGSDRVGNHFCLRASDAEYVILEAAFAFSNKDYDRLHGDNIRYASLNFNALPKYGSLEFRAMATEEDFTRISLWVNILYRLLWVARNYKNIGDILYDFSRLGPEGWVEDIMGPYFKEFKDQPNLEKDAWVGLRLAQDFIYLSEERL